MFRAIKRRCLKYSLLVAMLVSPYFTTTSRAQMILPLPSDLDSLPAFRLSGGAASAGSISDFTKLDIAENSSIGALFEFSPLREPETRRWPRRMTIYTTVNKGSDDWLGEAGSFDAGQLLYPLTTDIAMLTGSCMSIHRWIGDNENDRNEIAFFADYSLQQRKISRDSITAPGNPPVLMELPLNISTWHIGLKYSWTTKKKDTAYMDNNEAETVRDSAESLFRIAEANLDSAEGPIDSSNFHLAKEIKEIADKNYKNTAKSVKIVRLTMGIYYINIQIAKNTMDSFNAVLNETNLRDAYRGVGMKFAFQYRAFGYEFDYRYIIPREPDVRGLMGSSFATRITMSGQILDAF